MPAALGSREREARQTVRLRGRVGAALASRLPARGRLAAVPATPGPHRRRPASSAPCPAQPSPPAQSPAADLFLRPVESFLDVLGEDARLDVGHGCGSAEAASSRARVGPAAAAGRRTWRGGAGAAGEERRERRGGAGRRRAAASAGSREGGARPGTCLKRQSGGGTRRGWRRRGAGWGGTGREGARSQNAQVVPTVMEQKARRRKGSSRSRTWRQPGFF